MPVFDSLDAAAGAVIRDQGPYVKLLTRPRLESYELVPGLVVERWEALAQVDSLLAIVSLTVKEGSAAR